MANKADPSLFSQNIIAVVFDFDKTLIPYNMQKPLFKRYGVEEGEFWREVEALPKLYQDLNAPFDPLIGEVRYLNHFLSYVKSGKMAGLTNEVLREEARNLEFYPGVLTLFDRLKGIIQTEDLFVKANIILEFYVISSGFRQMILGSAVGPYLRGAWGCEFLETGGFPGFLSLKGDYSTVDRVNEISSISYMLDNTTKTRVLFEINKGSNVTSSISVNSKMSQDVRRVPFGNMIYIADGPSDIPVFSLLNDRMGKTFCVYNSDSRFEFDQARGLQDENRVQGFGPADFNDTSHTYRWLVHSLEQIGYRIFKQKKERLSCSVSAPPKHLS